METDSKEEMKDILQTSQKLENISKKAGLREGISAGRDSNFQESFDKGFEEGFKNGFLLGKCKGILTAISKQTSTEERLHPVLENMSSGSCELCRNGEQGEENIDILIETQNNIYKSNIVTLKSSFEEENICKDWQT